MIFMAPNLPVKYGLLRILNVSGAKLSFMSNLSLAFLCPLVFFHSVVFCFLFFRSLVESQSLQAPQTYLLLSNTRREPSLV